MVAVVGRRSDLGSPGDIMGRCAVFINKAEPTRGLRPLVTSMKRYPFVAAATGLFVPLVAVSASSAPASSAPSASIVIKDFAYSGDLTVKTGQTVTVSNADPAVPVPVPHTLTDKQTVPLFNSGLIQPAGGTATFTAPAKPGSYPFGCSFHLFMAGTLVVQG